jgi:glycosyltransferase involved in cell wall biosynthesis
MVTSAFSLGQPFARLPVVTVIITNYNYAGYVELAIESIRRQSYPHIECVIVDDCSRDASFEVITRCLDVMKDARFRAVRLSENKGQLGAMQAGLDVTSGPLVYFLDSDDIALPDFIRRHVEAHLNGGYSAGLTASDTIQIDGDGQMLETTTHALLKHRSSLPDNAVRPISPDLTRYVDGESLLLNKVEADLLYVDRYYDRGHVVATSALMFRRDAVAFVMPRDTSGVRICADYYLATYVHMLAGTITIGSALSCYRLHRKNNFSSHGVLGGPTAPGHFEDSERGRLDALIAQHMIESAEYLNRYGCLDRSMKFLRKALHPGVFYAAVKGVPELRRGFGRGSERYFRCRFGIEAIVYNRFPRLHRLLLLLRARLRRAQRASSA